MRRAVDYCRARNGPALVHAHVIRPYSHSLSDDEKLYRSAAELEADAQRDPIPRFGLLLVREGILDEKELEALEAAADQESHRGHRPGAGRRAAAERVRPALDLFAGRGSHLARIRVRAGVFRRRQDHGRDGSGHAGR